MHDLKFANEILYFLNKRCVKDPGSAAYKATTINVRLSPFSHVTPEGLTEAFAQLSASENLNKVCLNIKLLEFELICRSCEAVTKSSEIIFSCPKCEGQDFDIRKEHEFMIDSVEV